MSGGLVLSFLMQITDTLSLLLITTAAIHGFISCGTNQKFSLCSNYSWRWLTQFSATVKTLRSDSGGEYMSHAFQSFLQSNGIVSQRSCSYNPQQKHF
jgi:hypothetical protein